MFYTEPVRFNWKSGRLAMLALPVVLGLFGAGCSGINAGGSVSPAMFFIPGAKADPAPAPDGPLLASASVSPFVLAQ
jgi:hypothetical protein